MAYRRLWWAIPAVALVAWIAWDLSVTRRHSLADFDPHVVARLETDMWRSYYDHRSARLFGELTELLRTQYHVPFWRSCTGAYHAARAAVVFQRGHQRSDYELALPDLRSFYTIIRKGSQTDFPVEDAARLELEWWIVHRERAQHPPGDLEKSLADLQALIYRQPADRFQQHAQARADAMRIRDTRAESGGVTGADWAQIATLLDRSWTSLKTSVDAAAR